jgi:hypothetical protein
MDKTTKISFDFRGYPIVAELELVKRLFNNLEEELIRSHKRYIQDYEAEALDSQEDYELIHSTISSIETYNEEQIQDLRSVNIIRLFSLLERNLRQFCKEAERFENIIPPVFPARGSPIKKAREYICDTINAFDNVDPIWKTIELLNGFRNFLVHEGFRRYDDDDILKINHLFDKSPLSIIQDGEIVITKEICDHFFAEIEKLFKVSFSTLGWKTFHPRVDEIAL